MVELADEWISSKRTIKCQFTYMIINIFNGNFCTIRNGYQEIIRQPQLIPMNHNHICIYIFLSSHQSCECDTQSTPHILSSQIIITIYFPLQYRNESFRLCVHTQQLYGIFKQVIFGARNEPRCCFYFRYLKQRNLHLIIFHFQGDLVLGELPI